LAKAQSTKKSSLALVGAETLLGKELEEVLKRRTGRTIVSFSASGQGNFGEVEGEAVYVEPLEAPALTNLWALLVGGSAEGANRAYELARAAGGHPLVFDCSGHLESKPEARLVAPLVNEIEAPGSWLIVIAHPAAAALALCMKRLARYRPLHQVIAHIFEPASEQGSKGLSELHQQTTSLLSFKSLEKAVFDTQLAFNLLAQYGEEGLARLAATEQRIEKHVASILSGGRPDENLPMPSLRLVAAPVFHGYTLSLWIEFDGSIRVDGLAEALASAQIEVRGVNEEAPNPVGAAGQSGLIAGDIRIDPNNPRAAWFWIVCDNLRLRADSVANLVGKWDPSTP
jgi:aspartate-semialdehyde dehydrogenase